MKILLFIAILENIFSSSNPTKNNYCRNYRLLQEKNYPDCIINLSNESKIKIKRYINKSEEPSHLSNPKRKTCSFKFSESIKDTGINCTLSDISSDDPMNEICRDHKLKNKEDSIYFFNSNFGKIYVNLDHYIKNNIKETYIDSYLARLDKIMEIHSFLFENIHNLDKNRLIFDPIDRKLIYILEKTCVKFNADKKFIKEDCTSFLNKLFDILYKNKDILLFKEKLCQMSIKDKNILFHVEFIKCSKYFGEMPELMILGRFCGEILSASLLIPMHLINLLLCKRPLEENRIFVLFLIKKVFEKSTKNLLNFFSVQEWFFYCTKDTKHLHHKNLHFLLWEINHRKRAEIIRKLKYKCMTKCSISDFKHIRTVILLFLFQQMIFFRFINHTNAEFENYLDLMNYIIDEKDECSICDLNKFVSLLKKSNIKETKTQNTI